MIHSSHCLRPILAIHQVGSPAITVDVCWTTLRWSPLLWMGHPVDTVLLSQTSRWLQSRCAGCYWMLTIGKLQCQNLLVPDLNHDGRHARDQIWMYKFWLFHLCYPQGFFPNLNNYKTWFSSEFLQRLLCIARGNADCWSRWNLPFSSIVATTPFSTNETQPTQTESGGHKLQRFGCILCVGKFGSNESGPQPSWQTSVAGIPPLNMSHPIVYRVTQLLAWRLLRKMETCILNHNGICWGRANVSVDSSVRTRARILRTKLRCYALTALSPALSGEVFLFVSCNFLLQRNALKKGFQFQTVQHQVCSGATWHDGIGVSF